MEENPILPPGPVVYWRALPAQSAEPGARPRDFGPTRGLQTIEMNRGSEAKRKLAWKEEPPTVRAGRQG